MSWREFRDLKLDFEDLVKELDQFEQDAKSLQNRIDQFMSDAKQTTEEVAEIPGGNTAVSQDGVAS